MAQVNLQKKKMMSESNYRRLVNILVGLMASQSTIEAQCLTDYIDDGSRVYQRGNITIYNGYIYEAVTVTSGTFDESKWTKLADNFTELDLDTIKGFLGLTPEQLETMADLISTEIRLDKVFSSSDTYTRIDNALKEAKQYCLTQLASKSTGSFKIATSESEVTDGNYLYLIMNSSTSKYDIFALIEGNIEKLTTVDVNLSEYYTKDEIDNDFLKKTDADGKFATITTVDKKIDKTVVSKMVQHIDKYIAIDSPRNDSDELNRLYAGNDFVSFQKFTGNTIDKDFRLLDMVSGLTPLTLGSGEDLNDLNYNTFFSADMNCANIPYSANFMGISVVYAGVPNYGFQLVCDANENQGGTNTRTLFIRHNYNGTWGNWGKVCTTKATDVPKTDILSSNSNVTFGSHCCYSVMNGICYVTIWEFKGLTVSRDVVVATGMPKPKQITGTSIINANDSGNNVAFIYVDNGNNLCVNTFIPNVYGYGSFSYPVAEE